MAEKNCPYSKCSWLLIPIIVAVVTFWILKTSNSIFSSDPLSFWFSMVLSIFVGVWIAVGLKKIVCDKSCNMNAKK